MCDFTIRELSCQASMLCEREYLQIHINTLVNPKKQWI